MTSYLLVYDFFDENQNLCEVTSFLRMCDVIAWKNSKNKNAGNEAFEYGGSAQR